MKWFSCFIIKKKDEDNNEDIDGSVHGYSNYKTKDKPDDTNISETEVKKFDYIQECSICLNLVYDDDEYIKQHKTECNHIFHNECIKEWYRVSNGLSCPLCRCNKSTEENINDKIILENLRNYICSGYCYNINREQIQEID